MIISESFILICVFVFEQGKKVFKTAKELAQKQVKRNVLKQNMKRNLPSH